MFTIQIFIQYKIQVDLSINVTTEESDFVVIEIMMDLVSMPSYLDYWSQKFRYTKVADLMTLKRFINFVNNEDVNDDRYFKIRPLCDIIRQGCLSVPQEQRFSIDEMTVPYKGRKAGSRKQPKKPKKWDFKMFVLAGVSGIIYDFLLYGGEDTFRQHTFSKKESEFGLGGKVVIALCKSIAECPLSVVYFDNYFTSLNLIHYLRIEFVIFSLSVIVCYRSQSYDLPDKKKLKDQGRGSFSQIFSEEEKVCIVLWQDSHYHQLIC